jgi:hypothetical protein
MIDMRNLAGAHVWDAALTPIEAGEWGQEPFDAWWSRSSEALANLHPQIAEQWVYRHWLYTNFSHISLPDLTWRREVWPTQEILELVERPRKDEDAEHDYRVFHVKLPTHEPAKTMDTTGTWNFPILVLRTPEGVMTYSGPSPDARFWLIEGHKRMRYLNALASRNQCADEHALFVLTLEQ